MRKQIFETHATLLSVQDGNMAYILAPGLKAKSNETFQLNARHFARRYVMNTLAHFNKKKILITMLSIKNEGTRTSVYISCKFNMDAICIAGNYA